MEQLERERCWQIFTTNMKEIFPDTDMEEYLEEYFSVFMAGYELGKEK